MTDEVASADSRQPPSLRELREAAGRELEGLARELHIDVGLLEALEAGDYERLGAPVYVKGHLKRFAAAIGADADALLAAYDAAHADTPAPPIVPLKTQKQQRAFVPFWVWLVVGAGVLLIALLIGFVLTSKDTPPPEPAASRGGSETPLPALPERRAEPVPLPGEPAPTTQALVPTASPQPASPDAAAPRQESTEPARPATADLELRYSGNCWTEVRDGDGDVLYSGTGREGDVRRVTGALPLTVVVGNRTVVDVRVDGEAFSIPAGAVRRRTARFIVPAP